MIYPLYKKQVALLLRVLPHVAQAPVFALKGGTAINMFEQNMPRLSVDIDLVYLLMDDRAVAMQSIATALHEICRSVEKIRSHTAEYRPPVGINPLRKRFAHARTLSRTANAPQPDNYKFLRPTTACCCGGIAFNHRLISSAAFFI